VSERPPLVLTFHLADARPSLDAVIEDVQHRLDRLQVPAAVSLEIAPAASSGAVLTIDGTSVVLPVPSDSDNLTNALDDACHRARELAITVPIAHAVWRTWFGEGECPASLLGSFRRLLRDGVRWGFRLDYLRPAAERLREGATDVDVLFEGAVAEVDTEIDVRVHSDRYAQLDAGALQDSLFRQLGLYLHPPKVVIDPTLDPAEMQIHCNDLLLPRERTLAPALDPDIDAVMAAAIRAHAGSFMTVRLTGFYLAQLWRVYPRVVEALASRVDERVLTRVLRHLLDEGVSIRDLRTIAGGLLNVSGLSTVDGIDKFVVQPDTHFAYPVAAMTDPARLQADDYAECARMGLWRGISNAHRQRGRTLEAYLLDRDLERRIAAGRGTLSGDDARAFVDAVRAAIGERAQEPVILTVLEVRRHVRRLLEHDLPKVAVLSYQELAADTDIQPIAKIAAGV
jgi:hypothetical protein